LCCNFYATEINSKPPFVCNKSSKTTSISQQTFPTRVPLVGWLLLLARARTYCLFFPFEQRALMLPCNLLCQLSHSRLHKLVLIKAIEKKTAIRAHASAKKAPFFQTQLCIMQLKKHQLLDSKKFSFRMMKY